MVYVSIDFSLNSSGITIFHNGKYHFLSYYNAVKMSKSYASMIDLLSTADNFHISTYKRSPISAPNNRGDGLYGWEREHISNCLYYGHDMVRFIIEVMRKVCGGYQSSEVVVILENYSYSSQSNTLIQMVENTMMLKYELMQHFNINNFYVIPAPRVKSFVGKGSFDKYDMLQAMMNENHTDNQFIKIVSENRDMFIKPKMKKGKEMFEVLSPVQDIVDSYWMLRYFLQSDECEKYKTRETN